MSDSFGAERIPGASVKDSHAPSRVHIKQPRPDAIQAWIIDKLAARLEVGLQEIDPRVPFTSYGLSSKEAVVLSGDLIEWLGRDLSPTLMYEYPTIEILARYLAGTPAAERPAVVLMNEGQATEPVAIVGIGCRFPGAHGPDAFWDLLREGRDAITEVPSQRWDARAFSSSDASATGKMNMRWGGFIDEMDRFDARFFGISRREAIHMDPQQRLLLEVAWEALEDAGQAPESLSGTRTGVFIGISSSDYGQMLARKALFNDLYWASGNALSIAANRLSYFFNFRGPSLAVDTACSSSLVAVHLACRSIWSGESTLALAGGVNLILSPEITVNLSRAGFMSPDGRCRAFDEAANGYVRGEGAGIVVLKPLSLALVDRDPIYVLIRGSAVNQDGHSNGLTAPNPSAQEEVLREAYAQAGVSPADIQYVETHGTGTALGDPIEVKALGNVVAAGRPADQPCSIGSVKTNIGHLEAAAGIAGLIKVALSLKHRSIPPSLHFNNPNPHIPFDRLPVYVQQALRQWPETEKALLAGVSSFGFGGTNSHVVLEGHLASDGNATADSQLSRHATLMTLSARSAAGLRAMAEECRNFLRGNDSVSVDDLCYTTGLRRSHHDYRLAMVVHSAGESMQKLDGFLKGEAVPGVSAGEWHGSREKLVFVFSGQGTQWPRMCQELQEQEPVFQKALRECDGCFRLYAKWSLLEQLRLGEDLSRIADTEIAQPVICAVQIALAALWKSWGISPDAVIGHSVGEVAAACVAGALSVQQAMEVVYHRGRAMQPATGKGRMVALRLSVGDVGCRLGKYEKGELSVAAVNGPSSLVVAGDPAALDDLVATLEREGVPCQLLDAKYAFHSPQMAPFQAELVRSLNHLQPQAGSVPIYSTLMGKVCAGTDFNAAYWGRNVVEPVRFAAATDELIADGYRTFLEVGSHPVLCGAIHQCLDHRGRSGTAIASMRRNEDARTAMLESLGCLYAQGYSIQWGEVCGSEGKFVRLPSYPWQHEEFWMEAGQSPLAYPTGHPLLGQALKDFAHLPGTHVWETELNEERLPWLAEHVLQGVPVLPLTGYIELALAASHEIFGGHSRRLSELAFHRVLPISGKSARMIQVGLSPEAAGNISFQVCSRPSSESGSHAGWELHASGKIHPGRWESAAVHTSPHERQAIDFSLMFFAASDNGADRDKYRLVVEAAKFADSHDFASISVPERHFTSFGCIYPNPAVLHAALARETKRVWLRAGSVVLPLHNPIRVAEEWAMVDNLSGGRVELCFASGWHPDDFVLAPHNYAGRHAEMFRGIKIVQDLWSGKAIHATSGSGAVVEVKTFPTPLQAEVPIWITAAGNPETFSMAGELGANLLTHLLDQDFETLAAKIAIYRDSRKKYGHDPDAGRVSVMLHTFIGDDLDTVREQVRKPYCDYLKTIFFLLKGLSYSRGRQVDLETISEEERDETINALFERFFSSRALLGTKDSCRHLVEQLQAIGVNDISCLLDFGVDADLVLASLPRLAELKDECKQCAPASSSRTDETSIKVDETFLESIEARCPQIVDGPEFYRIMNERGLWEGPSFRGIEKLWCSDGEALATLKMPRAIEGEAWAFEFHPALLGACFETLLAALPREGLVNGQPALWLPVSVRSFTLHQRAANLKRCWSHAQLEANGQGTRETCDGNIQIVGPEGELLAEANGVKLQRLGREPQTVVDNLDGLAYELQWREVTSSSSAASSSLGGRDSWIVFADRKGFGQRLATLLEQQGHRCFVVSYKGDQDVAEGRYCVDLRDPNATGSLLTSISAQCVAPLRGIVHLWSLDAGDGEATASSLERGQSLGSESALHLIQALAGSNAVPQPRIWFVTQGAQATGATTGPVAVNQSPLWGLGRTCSIELPELWGGLIDLDPEEPLEDAAAPLKDILYRQGDEDQIAIRKGTHLAARLVPRAIGGQLVTLRPDGSYLITGGLDGVGFEVARWMVTKGARNIILLGRRRVPPRESWNELEKGGRWEKYIANLKSLENAGARVDYFSIDVADEAEMDKFFVEFASANFPPICGIVHAASVWENKEGRSLVGALLHLDVSAVRQVLSPKVTGSWLLARHLSQTNYDFMVFFSSAASVCGSPGQGNYAAAGAFLDALAHHLHAQGKPVISINWGPISGAGFGASTEGLKIHEYWQSQGIHRITVEQVLQSLGRVLGQGDPQIGVMKIDWIALGNSFPQIARMPWAQELFRYQKDSVTDHRGLELGSELVLGLLSKGETERREIIKAYLCKLISRSLRLSITTPEDQPLSNLGLDSLVALELRNRIRAELGVNIAIVKFLQGPSIAQLATYLSDQIGAGDQNANLSASDGDGPETGVTKSTKVREQVEKLSDEQVDALLSQIMDSRKSEA